MDRVAIVIVTYNSGSEIGGCLDALASTEAEIIVVDNASSDDTREQVVARSIRLIANPVNAGFAVAVNQGVQATAAPLILSLNPDAHLVRGLGEMGSFFQKPDTGAVGGMLTDTQGNPQKGFMARNLPSPAALTYEVLGINRIWPANPVNWNYRCLGLDHMTASLVDQPAGAFLMFSRAAWTNVGGFDERFFPIWFEDVDFCARLKAAGYLNYYTPAGIASHTGAHSIDHLRLENRERYWYGSLLEYAAKHYKPVAFKTTCVAVAFGAAFRAVRGFPHYKLKALEVYGGIVLLALSRAFQSPAKHSGKCCL
jgi:N-acetylglucosaminyl-diphospho-decaprenol L-rhamnosyltransferase